MKIVFVIWLGCLILSAYHVAILRNAGIYPPKKDTACKGNKVGNGMRAIFCYLDHYAVSWLKKAPGMHPVLF